MDSFQKDSISGDFFRSIPLGTVIHAESGLFKRGNGNSFLSDNEAQI